MFACMAEELDAVAARLIAAGANLNLVNQVGGSALIIACGFGRAVTAMLLVEAGAELNVVEKNGFTALDRAIKEGLEEVAVAIRKRGGLTAAKIEAEAAAKAASPRALNAAAAAAALAALAGPAGAPASARDKALSRLSAAAARAKGELLREACRDKDVVGALRLISEGADLDCVDAATGWAPLTFCCIFEELDEVAAGLIAAGARLDLVSKDGWSALYFACSFKRAAMALRLLEAGAAVNVVTLGGNTALDIADAKGLAAVAEALRARGGLTGAELKEAAKKE